MYQSWWRLCWVQTMLFVGRAFDAIPLRTCGLLLQQAHGRVYQ